MWILECKHPWTRGRFVPLPENRYPTFQAAWDDLTFFQSLDAGMQYRVVRHFHP